MKQEISPALAAVLVVCLVAIVGFFVWKSTSGGGKREMDPKVAATLMQSGGAQGAPRTVR